MSFQNISLLVAVATIGIPIALHLIAKKEPRRVVFPSVRLLTQQYQANRSKVQIRRWWLLALRIAALVAVALTLARPVIGGGLSITWATIGILCGLGVALLAMATVANGKSAQKSLTYSLLATGLIALLAALGWGGYAVSSHAKPQLDRSAPVALAIVVDNSPLSAWETADRKYIDDLRNAARQLILSANRESRIAIIDRSSTPAAFTLDTATALAKAGAINPLEVVSSLASRMEAAARLLGTSEIDSRQLVVLSSVPKSSFEEFDSGESLAALINDSNIRITLWDQGTIVGRNRQVSKPALSETSPAPDATVKVTTTVSLIDDKSEGPIQVTAECVLYPASASLPVVRDGKVVRPQPQAVDRVNLEVAPGREVEIQMTLPPLPVGWHHGAIRLVGQDALAIDDIGYFTVQVMPPSPLLIVSEQREESNEIAKMLVAPAAIDDANAQYAIEQITFQDLAATRLEPFDLVILLDPPESAFNEPEIQRFRESGGAMLVAVGQSLGTQAVSIDGWLAFKRPWRAVRPGSFLEISAPSHPALGALTSIPDGVPFQDFRVISYWQADVPEQASVLMRYAGTGHPALIELQPGPSSFTSTGRTMIMTTPLPSLAAPNRSWNQLFQNDNAWPAFYLIRDVTRYLAGRNAEEYSGDVGTAVAMPLRSVIDDVESRRRLQWFPPLSSAPVPIELPETTGDDAAPERVVIGRPKHSGVSWIRGGAAGVGFTTNLPREHLDAVRAELSELESAFGSDVFRVIESLEQMEWTAVGGETVVSLWSPLMLIAFVVFMLEQILGNRFYRRSAADASVGNRRRATA